MRTLVVVFAIAASACGGTPTNEPPSATSTPAPVTDTPVQITEKWRAKHETDYRRDWVTIAGLHRLDPGTHSLGSGKTSELRLPDRVPANAGRILVADGWVRYEPAAGVAASLNGAQSTGTIVLKEPGKDAENEVGIGDVKFAVHESGQRLSLRVWDPNGQQVRDFAGFAWFPVDANYRVVARFIPDAKPSAMPVVNTYGDADVMPSEGVVEFTLNGETVRLRPFTTRPKRFYFVFRDGSSGHETYDTARFLYSDLLDDGTTVLDFNQAYNPPCAFNKFTTCPLPLKENRLAVKILAGEKDYAGHE